MEFSPDVVEAHSVYRVSVVAVTSAGMSGAVTDSVITEEGGMLF